MASRERGVLLRAWMRGCLLVLLPGFLTGVQAASPPGGPSGIDGPHVVAPGGPAAANLSYLPPFGEQPRPTKPFLHPRGPDKLKQEKTAGTLAPQTVGVQTTVTGTLAAATNIGFNGIPSAEDFCNCYPPDGAVAVSSSYILAAVNTAVAVWQKGSNPPTLILGPKSLTNFLHANKSCLPYVSDPFAAYDAAAGRFVLGALTYDRRYDSTICIAASQTSDPTGYWWVYAFPVSPSRDLLDFPRAAVGSDAIYLAGNQFLSGVSFAGARVYAYNKAQMYLGQATNYLYYNVGANAAGNIADSLYPAQGVGVEGAYYLSADNCNGCSTISLWKFTNPFTAPSFTLQGGATVTAYNQPPSAQQLGGGSIATNDVRNLGGYWYNGTAGATVYGTHPIGCNPGSGTVACVQWYQLTNIDSAPGLAQQGIYASDGQYRFFPNLAVDSSGNMILAYAYSSASDYAGVRYTGRLATDTSGTLQGEGVLVAGQAPINAGRYGDYAGTVLDPSSPGGTTGNFTVWHFEEYAQSGQLWGTWGANVCFVTNPNATGQCY